MMQDRSGVSPLIAAVLLIGLVVSIGGLLAPWVADFAGEHADAVDDRSEQEVQCRYAGLYIESALFDDPNDLVEVRISNSGTVDLTNVTVLVMNDTQVMNRTFLAALPAGGTPQTATVTYKNGERPDRARAVSKQCPLAADEETSIGVK